MLSWFVVKSFGYIFGEFWFFVFIGAQRYTILSQFSETMMKQFHVKIDTINQFKQLLMIAFFLS